MWIKLCTKDRGRNLYKTIVEFPLDLSIPPAIIRLNDTRYFKYSHFNFARPNVKQHYYLQVEVFDVRMEVSETVSEDGPPNHEQNE